MKKTVIVVFGQKRHGKDEAARVLARELDGIQTSFATPLKLGLEHLAGVPHDLPDAEKETRLFYGKTARQWWQWFGTEIGRDQVNKDVWVDRAADAVKSLSDPYGPTTVVISDGRFYNEREKLRSALAGSDADVFNILVFRPGLPETDVHASETEVRDMGHRALAGERLFDQIIMNDGTLENFHARVLRYARVI